MEVDFSPALNEVIALVAVILTTVVVFYVRKAINAFQHKVGIELEAHEQATLLNAVRGGVLFGLAKVREKYQNRPMTVEIKNELLALAASYVAGKTPDALAYFGYDPDKPEDMEKLKELIESRLGGV